MKNIISACRAKPLHLQSQQRSWTIACHLYRREAPSAEQGVEFGQQKRIQQQARQQSGRL